ncbi:MAG: protein-glutamate O-methyltransferase CheR [Ignavibacteriales bacterium]|nr:protein-glutamate O-methyltransferase CheR [Ignavibacteriales bacterium]
MSDEMFRTFRGYIYELTGIYFQDNKKYLLEGRLSKRLQVLGLASYDQYFNLLKYGSQRKDELFALYDAVTINETFFFRNEPQFEALQNSLIPELMPKKKSSGQKLRIWSSASSSGEEAYTLSMIFHEKIRIKYPNVGLEVVGTDINSTVLDIAQRGQYREYAIRNTPKEYLNKYFVQQDGKYNLKDEVKRYARFEHLNLYDQQRMRAMRNFDVIFCCNVLIYFDAQSKTKIVSNLYDSLNPGGYLFIGYAESLHGVSKAFKLVNFPKTIVYKKD